ncbi:cell cycle checkpoint protein RAD17 [Citrus sinensis]|uniref:cell cycle checkpoint protein RAD17 isoform X1 n=1 Tax=Citrus sinensis TaxID=2711 RepID=UPI0003D71C47|nr:cell cycle checkpoint protein RAD17 isoform X1 [Citrus sinensis]KAH9662637.1 cell cycle checkpoint protein RAD17 [Citrus sinensis]
MGEENEVIVISSDDEEFDLSLSLNRGSGKSKKTSLVTLTNPRSAKKPCLRSDVNEISLSFEKFDEVLNGSKVSNVIWNQENDSALGSSSTQQLWTDKYKLCSLEEPDVQKKNVEHFLTPSRFEGLVNPKRDLALGSSSRQQLWTNKNKPCSLEEHAIQKENVGRFLTPSRFEGLVNPDHDSASASSSTQQLWAEKYKPRSLEELAVQRKKVEEVRAWFEERLGNSKDKFSTNVLVITGQAGVGKTATVRQIASHLGARLYEWDTPTPTIWQEYMHNCKTGLEYTSKLDEFENFVERIRRYGSTSPSIPGESKSSAILLIDDLPVTNGRTAFERLRQCLLLLVRSTHIPTAVVLTECGKADSVDSTAQSFEELQSILVDAGARKVALNPITNGSIKRTLSKICRQEQYSLSAEQIDLVAQASGGDIRHAITSLQFSSLKQDPMLNLSLSISKPNFPEEKADGHGGFSIQFGRDETLSLFHALGKFLHNKRETDNLVKMDQDAFVVKEKFSRLPLKMDAPEKVLSQAHGQARPVLDFLHENFLDFISEDAIDDAWAVASYLSDADLLLASFRGRLVRYNEADNVLQSAAASVAARGVLFGNSHPVPPRWHAIRKPKLWRVDQSSLQKKKELLKKKFMAWDGSISADVYNGSSSSDVSVLATEYAPALKWLGNRTSVGLEAHEAPIPDNETQDVDIFEGMSLDDHESEISNYESEDDWMSEM